MITVLLVAVISFFAGALAMGLLALYFARKTRAGISWPRAPIATDLLHDAEIYEGGSP